MTVSHDEERGTADAAPRSGALGVQSAATERAKARVADVIVLGGFLVIAVVGILLSLEPSRPTPLVPMVLLGVIGLGALVIRRRHPVVAFAVALALLPLTFAFGSGAEAAVVVPILYRAGVTRAAGRAWLWFGATTAAIVAAALLFVWRTQHGWPMLGLAPRVAGQEPTTFLNVFLLLAAIALIATLIGINVGHRRRLVAALVDRADQLRRERDQQADIARAAERERIAREMHDVIAHSLAVMIALADGAEAAAEKRPDESRRAVARIGETGRRTLTEVRRLLASVREEDATADAAKPQPGITQLPALVEEFRAAGLPVQLMLRGDLDADPLLGFAVFRIVQESLTNVLRHAVGVRAVHVRVAADDGDVSVVVEDESERVSAERTPGRGLVGIRERAAFYDGEVQTGPRDGGGWRVSVRLPMGQDDD